MYGYFTMELIHLPALAHLVFSLFPTAFAGCLPRPTSAAGSPVTRLSPRLWYYTVSAGQRVHQLGRFAGAPPRLFERLRAHDNTGVREHDEVGFGGSAPVRASG